MKYHFSITITGTDYQEGGTKTLEYTGTIEFWHDPDTYGNGYYMGITSKLESFGSQSYDIRYDRRFNHYAPIPYIVQFFCDKYDGKDGAWKLNGITVNELNEA